MEADAAGDAVDGEEVVCQARINEVWIDAETPSP